MIAARADVEGRDAVVTRGLGDANPRVRYEALQTWGRAFQKASCAPVLAGAKDPTPHVSLLAIDLLGNGCPGAADVLRPLADSLTTDTRGWHAPAHAMVALAKTSPHDAPGAPPR